MAVTASLQRLLQQLRWLWHLRYRFPQRRKYFVSTILVVLMIYVKSWSPPDSSEYAAHFDAISWAVVFFAGALLTTDYDVLHRFGSSRLYDWIQNKEDIVSSVARYYHAKRYVSL